MIALCALAGLGAAVVPGDAARMVVTSGYPYAAQCPGAGEREVVDRWLMYACNCTSYVAWALAANRQRTDWFVAGKMDARDWPAAARAAGLPVRDRARVGAVAVWPDLKPPFGHVAYVSAVDRDGRFDVAEYNYPGADGPRRPFLFDRRYGLTARGATFIYVPERRRHDA